MLPVGKHLVKIEKDGFRTFQQEINFTSDQTLRVTLHENNATPKIEPKTATPTPTTAHTQVPAKPKVSVNSPSLITVLPGQYLLGEHAAKPYNLDHAFALSATLVTVDQFQTFVNQTKYKTDAELKIYAQRSKIQRSRQFQTVIGAILALHRVKTLQWCV